MPETLSLTPDIRRLKIAGADGQQLALRLREGVEPALTHRPRADSRVAGSMPVLLLFPAMGIKSSYYDNLTAELARQGFPTGVCDLRGQGESTPRVSRRSSFGQHEMISEDWPRAVAAVRAHFPGRRLVLVGHSLGGQLCTAYLGRPEADADALILIASGTPHFRVYPRRVGLRVLLGTRSAHLLARLLRYFPGDRIGFAGRESRGVIRDWAHTARTGRCAPAGADIDYEAGMRACRVPVLTISIEGDRMHTAAAMAELSAKLGGSDVEAHAYTQAEAWQPLDRYRWARHPGPIPEMIRAWTGAQGLWDASERIPSAQSRDAGPTTGQGDSK